MHRPLHRSCCCEVISAFSVDVNRIFVNVIALPIFVAEYGASEDSVQRQSSSGAAPSAAAAGADDGTSAGPDPDRLRRVQEPLDPLAVENLPDMRPGMLRN